MITVRKSSERGSFDHGWLDTKHTFSFAGYRDSRFLGFRSLRVINEDRIAPGQGFGTHPHRDMEIVTYVVSGALEHRDSLGSGGVLRRGDVQAMTAGTGLTHSEFNHSHDEPCHLLQIWLIPDERGTTPRYDQKHFDDESKRNRLAAVVSGRQVEEALRIGHDSTVYATLLDTGREVTLDLADGRAGWIQVIEGEVDVNGTSLTAGDGAALETVPAIRVTARMVSELLVFDLP